MNGENQRSIVFPANLRDVYAESGRQSIKFILDQSEQIDSVDVKMTDADGKPMNFSFKRWGTKVNVSFVIDENTPDGVSIIDVFMSGRNMCEMRERFCLWTVR